jgi:alkaline phosphatase D
MSLRRPSVALLTLTLALVASATDARARTFSSGVASGEVAATSAKVWTRAPRAGAVEVLAGARRGKLERVARVRAKAARDRTVTVRLRKLRPGKSYYYAFRQGKRRSPVGEFRTAPGAKANEPVRFAWSGDADATPLQPGGPPFWNRFEVYRQMASEDNAFNINMGDTIYSDTEVGATNENGEFVPGGPVALTLQQKWAKYKRNLSLAALRRLRASSSLYSHWDDHEFINDFTMAENGSTLYRAGVRAFRDYAPVSYTSRDGLYRSFRWGRNLEVFFLDERSFRSAKASADGVCNNPQTGSPDLAPTGPQATRNLFALVVPSLAEPVSAECLAAINDPKRTLLGVRQYRRFTRAVRRSDATWKVIMNEVPIQQFYALPYDRWEGYAAERTRLLTFLRDNVDNVVFLTTDVHANFVNDARLQTLEEGGPVNTGILDVTTGPVATKNFELEIEDSTGSPGSGALITQAFFKAPPPTGVGMICAAPNVFSYGEVTVTSGELTIELKDQDGNPVVDRATNAPCETIRLQPAEG